ncbi:hypothetical protein Q5P01_012008 [Channa striata]|uniref:non-specific serine/threonine protein kinase n=1 Tax=Channa striata TaxID=64152 RepID=A0AA88SMF0_CHASR|nr:hypothetical protein Q5P01_012008 [Channa striata]
MASFSSETANALAYMNRLNLIHRDITPNNLLLTEDLTVKVADLGLARQSQSPTETGVIRGGPECRVHVRHRRLELGGRDCRRNGRQGGILAFGALFHVQHDSGTCARVSGSSGGQRGRGAEQKSVGAQPDELRARQEGHAESPGVSGQRKANGGGVVKRQRVDGARLHHRRGEGHVRASVPDRLTLDQRMYFTFKEYTAEIPTWLAEATAGSGFGNWTVRALDVGARLLVYGTPPCARGDQADPESLSRCGLSNAGIRNLVLRLKAKVLGEKRLKITVLNCTSTPLKVTVNRSALTGISRVDELDRARLQFCEQGKCYIHDANPGSLLDSLKWAPVIMFAKHMRTGPLRELSEEYYKVICLKGFPRYVAPTATSKGGQEREQERDRSV